MVHLLLPLRASPATSDKWERDRDCPSHPDGSRDPDNSSFRTLIRNPTFVTIPHVNLSNMNSRLFPTKDRGDEWFISSFLFGLHLPPLTSRKGEFSPFKNSLVYRKTIRIVYSTALIPVCQIRKRMPKEKEKMNVILSFPSEDID